jgi:3-phosphoshikimate 1-carboxyvinyltransferase
LRAQGIEILDPGCTAKTFPDYFDRLADVTATAR